MNKLTVIIPFLNEGIEIKHTLHSIRSTACNNVDILLINDYSQDGFDYKNVAQTFNTYYIKNEERKGVAKCRDIGVSMINTPYFILIDGHMRFYENNWWNEIIFCLEKDDRAIYSCQCRALGSDGHIAHDRVAYGAFIEITGNLLDDVLGPNWITIDNNPGNMMPVIPCILGASYAMSKRYWDIIRGLNGLRYYGSDETYLSLKVWLEGGRCILLKNVEIGHIFRNVAPYSVFWADSIYNKLFIADTVIPAYSHEIQAKLKKMFPSDYYLAKSIMLKNIDEVNKYRLYYETIFTRDFAYFKTINKSEKFHTTLKERLTKKVKEIASALMQTSSQSPGLMFGEMGEIVFLYEYANYIKNQNIADFANEKLNVFLQRAKTSINHYNFHHGMAGVGVALTYLNNKDYIEFDVSSYFEDINIHIENFVLEEIKSNELGFLNHALGIEYYLSQQKSYNFSHQDLIIEALQSQNKNRNGSISISNGAIGSLAFLLYIWQLGYNSIPLKKTITRLVKQIEHTEIEKQLKYDSGDLVSAFTLLRVALEFSDNNLRNRAINLILATCQRRDTIREHVFDASIMQGSSGTALIYYLSFAYTGLKVIEEALNYWTEDILDKSISDEGSAGFLPYNLNNPDCNSSLIYGSSGIGLTLISMLSGQIPEWKNWLML